MNTFSWFYININMSEMNSAEQMWNILKYNDPTPVVVRELITDIINNRNVYHGDWEDIKTDGSLGSIKSLNTHFFHIFVYYDNNLGQTLVTVKFKEPQYADRAQEDFIMDGVDIYTIYTEDMGIDELKLEFGYVFDEFTKYCKRAEYMESHPEK